MRVVDSHTEGEPTRVILEGGPDLGGGSVACRANRFAHEFGHIRSALINEPRGSNALVGALLCEPTDATCATGVIFFNNVGNLGMCGHATIGTAITLAHLGRIEPGSHKFETPVGIVSVDLKTANEASLENVESYRYRKDVSINVDGIGVVTGDIAWGGNWFFLTAAAPCSLILENVPLLTQTGMRIRQALVTHGITGLDGAEIDHIEFFSPPLLPDADSRNFVLCPGGAYDRSPCGTGTSAKLACLAADGLLKPGVTWTQESIIGSRFLASYQPGSTVSIRPTLTGRAYVYAESILFRDPTDPFADGIRSMGSDGMLGP